MTTASVVPETERAIRAALVGDLAAEADGILAALGGVRTALGGAGDAAALADAAKSIAAWAGAAHHAGLGPLVLTRALAGLNDTLVANALRLVSRHHRLPPTPWCWLGLGSEGRGEQTLVTDQDNALIFLAANAREAEQMRGLFLPWADEVNRLLAAAGVPLCQGGVMAGKPACCLSLEEWTICFSRWIRLPEPEALLNATIYFDFRPLAGDVRLAQDLRRHLGDAARGAEIFLHMLAENALKVVPPLGRLRDFASDEADGALDLKKFGVRLFVDAARVLALAEGSAAVATGERLAASAAAGTLASGDAAAAVAAMAALQGLRLACQVAGPAAGNRVRPDALNSFERAVLLAALRQARSLQTLLKMRFRVEG